MTPLMTLDEILPLVARLAPGDRLRLLRLISGASGAEPDGAYAEAPPSAEEFSVDGEDPLAWEGEGWEDVV